MTETIAAVASQREGHEYTHYFAIFCQIRRKIYMYLHFRKRERNGGGSIGIAGKEQANGNVGTADNIGNVSGSFALASSRFNFGNMCAVGGLSFSGIFVHGGEKVKRN